MFDKLKQLNELRKMKNAMSAETATAENNGVKITINGNFTVEEVFINAEARSDYLENNIKNCFNDAVGKMQSSLAQKFSGMLGQ